MRFKAHSPSTVKGIKIEWDAPVELSPEIRQAMLPNDVETMRAGVLLRGYVVANITYPRGTIAFRVAEAHEVFLQLPAGSIPASAAAKVRIESAWSVEDDGAHLRHRGTVGTDDDDERIDVVIATRAPGISRAKAQRMIEDGCVSVAGQSIRKANHRLRAGDRIELLIVAASDTGN